MDKAKLLKVAKLFEAQAVMLLKEARRLRAMAEGKKTEPKRVEDESSCAVH